MNSEKRPLTAEDLYRLKLVSNPQISPDGKHIIFAVNRVDEKTEKKYSDLWLIDVESGELQQFTYGDYTDTNARWSPNGRYISYLSNRKKESQMQLYLLPFGGGEGRPLTEMEGSFASYEWSPDGSTVVAQFRKKDEAAKEREEDEQKKKLGVVARHITSVGYKFDGAGYMPEEKWHIWRIDADSGEATQLTDGDFHESEPTFSPDGSQILFTSNRHPRYQFNPDESSLYLIPADGGEMSKIETRKGQKGSPSFSPDGTQIAYFGSEQSGNWYQNTSLYIVPAAGGESRSISAAHDINLSPVTMGDVSGGTPFPKPRWSADGTKIYTILSQHGNQPVIALSTDGSGYELVSEETSTIDGFSMDAAQTKIAYPKGSIDAPEEIAVQTLMPKAERKLTKFNQEWLDEIAWGNLEETWIDAPSGTRLHGWILKPHGFDPDKTYPSILEIHGGPFTQYGRFFMHEFHYLAANGYVVYYTNPRGSQGYGEAHAGAISNQWGTVDYDDVMAWTDYVAEKPYIDTERMGVTGGSYGGYMTSLIIGKTDRFKAAVAQRVVSNLISFYGSSDMTWGIENLASLPDQPWNNLDNYWKQSPIAYIGNAKTPTLIIHSEMDLRCDREQGEQVFAALQRMGVDSEMVLFPNESHGLSRNGRTDRRIQRLSHMLRWFDKYLKG